MPHCILSIISGGPVAEDLFFSAENHYGGRAIRLPTPRNRTLRQPRAFRDYHWVKISYGVEACRPKFILAGRALRGTSVYLNSFDVCFVRGPVSGSFLLPSISPVAVAVMIGGLAPPCPPVLGASAGFLNPFGGGDHLEPMRRL